MAEGDVCPDEPKLSETGRPRAIRPPQAHAVEPRYGSWFLYGASPPIIGVAFRSHLGNVG